MKKKLALGFLACALALASAARPAVAVMVHISMNVFPTTLANPHAGGSWDIVAKTDSPYGISAISAYLRDIDVAGVTMESDIGGLLNGGNPFVATFGDVVNLVYGQDTASGPVVFGVGLAAKSDGPDPLGDPAWDDATLIFSGTYNSNVPTFATMVGSANNETDANTFSTVIGPPYTFAINADTTTVVRVAVPEPATIVAAVLAAAELIVVRRRK